MEHSGSVVECLTQTKRRQVPASPASLRCVLEQDTLILALYCFNPGRPVHTKLLMGGKESNQMKKVNKQCLLDTPAQ